MPSPAPNTHHREVSWRGHQVWVLHCSGTDRHTADPKVTNAPHKIAQSRNSFWRCEDDFRAAPCICSTMGYPCGKSLPATLGLEPALALPPCPSLEADREDMGEEDQLWWWPLPPCTADAYTFACRGILQKAFGVPISFWHSDLLVAASSRLSSACMRKASWGFVSNLPPATKC